MEKRECLDCKHCEFYDPEDPEVKRIKNIYNKSNREIQNCEIQGPGPADRAQTCKDFEGTE